MRSNNSNNENHQTYIFMKNYVLLLLLIVSGISCKNTPPTTTNPAEELPKDFVEFYKKFLQDSSYQMSHIQFPLAGVPSQANQQTEDVEHFRWQKEDWKLHRDFDPETTGFNKKFVLLSDELIIEYIIHKSHKFGLERRFSKLDDDWSLIYYSDINNIKN